MVENPEPSRCTVYDRIERIRRQEKEAKDEVLQIKKPFIVWATTKHGAYGNLDEGDKKSWAARRVAFKVAPSIVGLSSFVGEELLLSCSGLIIEKDAKVGTILTSASLLIGDEDTIPNNVKVEVHLPNRKTVSGSVSHVDLHHNIAIITVLYFPELLATSLLPFSQPYFPGKFVVALGRDANTYNLLASHGELKLEDNGFDSEDVLSTSCKVTSFGIGGPLVDISSGMIIGLNFFDSGCTVFLPSLIVLRCLKHFKNYGKIVRPWLGMRTRVLDTLKMAQLETIYQKFPDIDGVYVEKVIKGSPADSAGVYPGDIVTYCDGDPVCSPLEFVEKLFDKAENSLELSGDSASKYAIKRRKIAVEVVIKRESSGSMYMKSIIVDRLDPPEHNRWPLRR